MLEHLLIERKRLIGCLGRWLDGRDVVSVLTSRSRDGLETYRRSRLGLISGM